MLICFGDSSISSLARTILISSYQDNVTVLQQCLHSNFLMSVDIHNQLFNYV